MQQRYKFLPLAVALAVLRSAAVCHAGDCNANGVDDATDLTVGTSADCNANGIPDDCDVVPFDFSFVKARIVNTAVLDTIAADFDGDGDLDIAGIGSGATVILNDGSGGLGSPRAYSIGDGDTDLAVARATPKRISILKNDGTGSFTPAWDVEVGEKNSTVADLTGDGRPDLSLTGGSSDVTVLRNASAALSKDCNANLTPDECDITLGTSPDADGDGVPDECGARFHRGDPNNNGGRDLSDGIFIFGNLFLGGRPPAPPGPTTEPCGRDVDPGGSANDLGCESYSGC